MTITKVELERLDAMMARRDHSDLLSAEARRHVLLELADAVPGLCRAVLDLKDLLLEAHTSVDSYLCPSIWKTAEGRKHDPLCIRIQEALNAINGIDVSSDSSKGAK